jgi:hypothetical protein
MGHIGSVALVGLWPKAAVLETSSFSLLSKAKQTKLRGRALLL